MVTRPWFRWRRLGAGVGLLAAAGSVWAQAPAQIAGAFAVISFGEEYVTTDVVYFATDGTYDILSSGANRPATAGISYAYVPSSRGTYRYAAGPGSPSSAELTFSSGALSTVTGVVGPRTLDFTSATLAQSPGGAFSYQFFLPTGEGQLLNVSNRARLRAGDTAIAGFVIGGSPQRPVLIRAVGPTLAGFGVTPASPSPQFQLFAGTGTTVLASSTAWTVGDTAGPYGAPADYPSGTGPYPYDAQAMGWIFGIIGALPLEPAANEQVYFGFLSPGVYTVQTIDPAATAAGGWELTEVYIFAAAE